MDEREFDLGRAIAVVRRRRGFILATAAAGVTLAAALTLVTEPVYRATTRIEVNKSSLRSPITGQTIESDSWHSDDITLFTAAELVTNREMLAAVVQDLESRGALPPPRPSAWRRWAAPAVQRVAARLGVPGDAMAFTEPHAPPASRGPEWLIGLMHVKPVKDTRLVRIQVDHPDPALARQVADAVARRFVEVQSHDNTSGDLQRSGEMRRRVAALQASITAGESLLYADERDPVAIGGELERVGGAVASLNEAYTRAQTERLAIEARIAQMRRLAADTGAAGTVASPTLDALRRDLQACRNEMAQAQTVYRPMHPRLVALESRARGLEADIRLELESSLRGLEGERSILVAREQSLNRAIAAGETQRRALGDRTHRNLMLESELRNQRETLALLQTRLQDAELSGEVREPAARVVETARVEARPVRPRPLLNGVVGLLLGLLAGAGIAFLGEAVRRTIRTPEDATHALQLPILAVIPRRT